MAVFGDIDSGVFKLLKLGVLSDGSSYTFDLGYGEGMSRSFLLPSVSLKLKLDGSSVSLGDWTLALVAGGIL
jgi:hypothetical protein